jgi:predicted KAP-like P-loop ATPase
MSQDISADRPLHDPQDDRLGYAPFARNLAENIIKMKHGESFVLGIYAPWGSGKSTLLNFVDYYLKQHSIEKQPIIVRFNPWWFSGQENLAKEFFTQLLAALGQKGHLRKIRGLVADLAERVSGTMKLSGIPIVNFLLISLKALRPRERDIFSLKEKLSDLLCKKGIKILVIIDDVDRLSNDEIRQCFQLIKAVADFPNVIYLVAFARDVVCDALAGIQGSSGEKYLQKIIQVPFELPTSDRMSLQRLLFEKLDKILIGTPSELFDTTYWGNVYHKGIDHFIHTPRDVTVLTNAIQATYPAVMGEVNPVDFIVIECLRIFTPFIYDIIRKNPSSFTGSHSVLSYGSSPIATIKPFHEKWFAEIPEEQKQPIRALVEELFPKTKAVWGNVHYGTDWEETWRKALRVCSGEIFPAFFRLSLPEGSFSAKELDAILSLAGDASAFSAKLLELSKETRPDGTNRARALLDRLEDYTDSLEIEKIPTVVQVLFDIGDDLKATEEEKQDMFDFGISSSIGRIVYQLLERLPEGQRFQNYKVAMEQGKALVTAAEKVIALGQQHGKYQSKERPEEERLLTAEHQTELEKIVFQKILEAAKDGRLAKSDNLPMLLFRWKEWGDENEMQNWLQALIESDEGLALFLTHFLSQSMSITVGDVVSKRKWQLDPRSIKPFVEPEKIIERVRALLNRSDFPERMQIALKQFVTEFDLAATGKNPEDALP